MPSPTQLSRQLRLGDTPDLERRRKVLGLSMVGAAAGIAVSLYQTGVISHLPDPPVGPFDSDRVDASDYAYKRAQTPDGLAMLVTYGVTALLAGAGGEDRARTLPVAPARARGESGLRRCDEHEAGAGGVGGERGVLRLLPGGQPRLRCLGPLRDP